MKLILLLIFLFFCHGQTDQRTLYLKTKEVTMLYLPEDAKSPRTDSEDFTVSPVKGHGTRLFSITSNISKYRGDGSRNYKKSNLFIITSNYLFEFNVLINPDPNLFKRTSRYIINHDDVKAFEKLNTGNSINPLIVKKANLKSKYTLDTLVTIDKDILEPNSKAPSKKESQVTFAVDKVFYYLDRILFKMTVINESSVPYEVENVKLKYNHKSGTILLGNSNEEANLELSYYNLDFSEKSKIVKPDSILHILYTIDKLGANEDGTFLVNMNEKNGDRNFELEFESRIKNIY